ncbi:MAG: hypothetical protein WDM96_09515 [Lacunisphaera sp.]
MKKLLITYVLMPGIMFGIFLFFYFGAVKEMGAKAEKQKIEKAAKDKIEAERKAVIEQKALADAEKRQKAREEEDAKKAADKEAAYAKVMSQLAAEAADYNAQADKLAKEAADLDISISQARTNKEKLNRDTFDLSKEVELTKINRRNAEIEIQRMVEMAGKKIADSSVAIAPPPPLQPVAK